MRAIRTCSIEGCGLRHDAHGYCHVHYSRWRRHGDPLGGTTPRGDSAGSPERFYRDVVLTDRRGPDDPCLIWPFAKNDCGYGMLGKERVSRLACEDANGPAPTPDHEAAHGCGKGHLACVTKGHLRWATHAENMADMIAHGTQVRGEQVRNSKITEATAREIIALKGKMPVQAIGKRFGVSGGHVNNIHLRKRWAWLRPE